MSTQTITLDGKKYVVIPRDEYEQMSRAAQMPPLPEADENGNYPAGEYMRARIARGIIQDRMKFGLSQAELARRAGIRPETLCRIESGKVTPNVATVDKIDRALKEASDNGKGKRRRKRR